MKQFQAKCGWAIVLDVDHKTAAREKSSQIEIMVLTRWGMVQVGGPNQEKPVKDPNWANFKISR